LIKQQREQIKCEELSEQSTQQRASLFCFSPQSDILKAVCKSVLSPSPHPENTIAELENAQKRTARPLKVTE